MVEAGMTNHQVIKSATSNAALALKMDDVFGAVKKGLKADVIAVAQNPLENMSNIRQIEVIMQNGRLIHEKNSNQMQI
jgi:imidazolonepropionase-like amidohydrolase